jgi:hypothetical protein
MKANKRASQISAAARKLGHAADPSAVQSLLIIPGAPDIATTKGRD